MVPFAHLLAQQFRKPSGLLGRYALNFMLRNNRTKIEWAVHLCDIQENDVVLEIGFGPGIGIATAAALATKGKVYGLDFSRAMVRRAARHNRALVKTGRVILLFGDAGDAPFADNFFDRLFAVNVVYFWPDPRCELSEVLRILKPGGRAVFYVTDRLSMDATPYTNTGVFHKYTAQEFLPVLQGTAFSSVRYESTTQTRNGKPVLGHCFIAVK